ncbi:GMC oxidoreductase [Mycena sanguinolenta]|uniref:GMC oxidoreductase n=1 Tax=Mycena sanguinolenta TaxID=230812 RepID=A0A8H6ZB18_9AGAR|nr:GMC oxidoreductase [Mycena sanguinolenta]
MARLLLAGILALSTTLCSGIIVENAAALQALKINFDFIVVGGGTAGNVVANRLSDNPGTMVLLLEAGGSNADVLNIIVPFYAPRATPDTAQDWNYTTTAQVGLNGRSVTYNRGFVLGGSSSVNYMVYTRGSMDDFDRWAKVTGDEGWSWESLYPYFLKNEDFTSNTTGHYDPSVHGYSGINTVSLSGYPTPIDSRIIDTTTQLDGYPFNLDMNSGNPIGIGWGQATIKDGSRSSSATSYLGSQYIARPNLHVLLNARVTRVLQTATGVVRSVEFVQDLDGPKYTVNATKEVILSAGSIGSPNILLHSGIGDSSALTELGISSVHNLPAVGQKSHRPLLVIPAIPCQLNRYLGHRDAQRHVVGGGVHRVEYRSHGSSGPTSAHYELIFCNGMLPPPPATGNFMSILPVVVSPASRGSITLGSNDPLADPLINPNLLGADVDLVIMREAVKSAIRYTTAPAWDGYVLSTLGLTDTSDAGIEAYIRANAGTIYHPVGSVAMSPKGASWGALNPDLTVKGLTGIRVVDMSIVPFIPAAHTQVSAYIIGERASDLIKQTWGIN